MIKNMKEIFPPKTGMRKATSLQDPGYVREVGDCMLHAAGDYSLLLSKTSEMVRITLCIIIQTIRIKKYIELLLQITVYFELKPSINSNYKYFELDSS